MAAAVNATNVENIVNVATATSQFYDWLAVSKPKMMANLAIGSAAKIAQG